MGIGAHVHKKAEQVTKDVLRIDTDHKVDKLRLVGLVRVSTEEQAGDDRAGIDRQLASIRAIAVRYDVEESHLTIVTVVDVSGSDLAKTNAWLHEVLPALQHTDTHLAVDELSRILRPDNLDFTVAHQLWQTGTTIYTPGGRIDPRDENGLVQIIVGGLLGGSEKKAMKRRVWGAKEAKRRRGEFPQSHVCLPTGVRFDRAAKSWSYTSEATGVREAFRLLVEEGETNLAAIGRMVGGDDDPVLAATVVSWLRNPIYKGLAVYDEKRGTDAYPNKVPGKQPDKKKIARTREEVIEVRVFGGEDQEPQLVSNDVWDATQAILADRSQTHRKRRQENREQVPYSGFMFSIYGEEQYADHVVYGRVEHRGTHVRYVCRCRQFDHRLREPLDRCELRRLPAEEINEALDTFLGRITEGQWFLDNVILPQMRERGPDIEEEIDRLKSDVDATERKLERLQEGWLDSKLEEDFYERKLAQLKGEKSRLQGLLARAIERNAAMGTAEADNRVRAYLQRLGGFDPDRPVGFRRGFLRQLVPEIIVSNDGIELLTLRVPQGLSGTPETLRIVWGISWEELLGYDPWDLQAKMQLQGLFSVVMLAERLGKKPDWVRHRVKTGRIPAPQHRYRHGKVWTVEEAEAIENALAEPERAEPEFRWGLPKKDRYTSTDVAQILGIKFERLRYLIDRGRLPDCKERKGRVRQWAEAEIEAVMEAYRAFERGEDKLLLRGSSPDHEK